MGLAAIAAPIAQSGGGGGSGLLGRHHHRVLSLLPRPTADQAEQPAPVDDDVQVAQHVRRVRPVHTSTQRSDTGDESSTSADTDCNTDTSFPMDLIPSYRSRASDLPVMVGIVTVTIFHPDQEPEHRNRQLGK